MLSLISSRRSDHPLDDKAARRAFLEEIARMKPVVLLGELSAHLDAVKTAENLRPTRALEIIAFLESAGEGARQALTAEYVGPATRMTRFHQGLIWNTVYTYSTQLAEAHRFCLAKWQVGAVGASGLKAQLPRIICHALRACTTQLKWALFRHGPVDPQLWRELGELYRLAEGALLAGTVTTLAPDHETTVEREFLRAMVLAASSPDALSAAQIQLMDTLIAQFVTQFRLSQLPGPGTFYVADLLGRQAPGRYSGTRKQDEHSRCFGPADAVSGIAQTIEYIDQHKTPPTHLAVGTGIDVVVLHATLRHLLRYWSAVPQERKRLRRRHTERVNVVHGYEDVVANVGGLFLESAFVSSEEEWLIENESDGGFGAFVPAVEGQWLKVGSLIGLRREEGTAFGAGVVRRIVFDEKKNCYLGIELLAAGGTAVTILPASMSAKGSAIPPQGELCILMATGAANTGEVTLMMRAGLFSHSQTVLMQAYDHRYLLLPLGLIEQGEDFDLARYRIMEEHQNAA